MSEGLEAARRGARARAAELVRSAADAAELHATIVRILRSADIDDVQFGNAAKFAVRDVPGGEPLRHVLAAMVPVLARQFGGDASLALASLIEARDPAVAAHHRAVEAAAVRLAIGMNFDRERLGRLAQSARFFDVGKLFVPVEILHGTGALDRDSWPLMKRHAVDGGAIAAAIPQLAPLAAIVRAHHERVDGHGYPDGIGARSIPAEAAVLSVADAWASVVSSRPFRPPMTIREAVLMLEDGRGSQWQEEAVDALLAVVLPRKLRRGSSAAPRYSRSLTSARLRRP